MQLKLGFVALGVMATLVLFNGTTVEAKSNQTDKKTVEPPVVVTVKIQPGDTLADIAAAHSTSYVRLFNANEKIANPDMIFVDDEVRIPKEDEELPDRFSQLNPTMQAQIIAADIVGQAAPKNAVPTPTNTKRASSAGNTYAYGWCTWYAKQMRSDLPNNLGNGGRWVANAAAMGLPTGTTPRVGAIAEEPGHVAYVEAVHGGMITISEMGYNYKAGQFNRRTVPASNYRYIY